MPLVFFGAYTGSGSMQCRLLQVLARIEIINALSDARIQKRSSGAAGSDKSGRPPQNLPFMLSCAILADPTCDTRPAWASDREVEADGSREQSGRVAEARHSERLVILLIAESKSKALVYAALGHFSCGWYPSLRCCVGVLA